MKEASTAGQEAEENTRQQENEGETQTTCNAQEQTE
jgi:hypothetical protein